MASSARICPSLHYRVSFIQRPSFKVIGTLYSSCAIVACFGKKATSGLYYLFRNGRCIHGSCRERDYMEYLNSYEWGLEKRLGINSESYWSRSTAKLGRAWRNGAGPRRGGRTGTAAAESALRAYQFTTKGGSAHGGVDGHAAASGGLGGAGRRRLRCASLWQPQSRRCRRSRGGAPPPARRRRPQPSRRSCGAEDKGEGTGNTATPGHWRDRQQTLKKRQ